jgi:radical SAM superfamily enzyme YgiQ (UPF0313 family)
MELNARNGDDRFVPAGAYRALEARLRSAAAKRPDPASVVVSAFDRRTRMLPFLFYDSRLFPAGAGMVAAALHQAGFRRTRAVFQLWNPRFRPSRARIDGRPIELLLISSLQIHSRAAYDLIRDARSMGADRPLIIAGGPKAIYEPDHFWFAPAGAEPPAPDIAVTGEVYVLLELLSVLEEYRGRTETLRGAFERARDAGALEHVPGLVYLAPGATVREPVLVDTGLQRLVQHLEEMPGQATALGLMEPPHWRTSLSAAPVPDGKVNRHAVIASVLVTQGCKFRCGYCPIPAVQQRTWRFRDPQSLVDEIRTIHQRFDIKYFFGADDNFFNRRETAEEILTAMARGRANDRPFRERIRFATESTEFDAYRNRDLLPLAREAGLHALWFGIEDLTATLINKGQKPETTTELFRVMRELKISPMAMMMFHDGQPFYTRSSLYGLANQIEFLRRAGAVSMQCTVHNPAVGTREYEGAFAAGRVLAQIGRYVVSDTIHDGNHVMVGGTDAAWKRQLMLLGGYATFYNPRNFVRALARDGSPLRRRRIGYQAAGMMATAWTALKVMPYVVRLATRPAGYHHSPPVQAAPVRHPPTAFPRLPETASAD